MPSTLPESLFNHLTKIAILDLEHLAEFSPSRRSPCRWVRRNGFPEYIKRSSSRYHPLEVSASAQRILFNLGNVAFVGLLVVCVLISVAAVFSGLEKREASLVAGGARIVDAAKIRKQMLDGHLSPQKALYYRQVPR